MEDYLPKNFFVEKGIEEPDVNICDNGEKEKDFVCVKLKDRNREEQIRELLQKYPSTDNSISLLIDEKGNVLKRFYRLANENDGDEEQAQKRR